MNRRITSLVAAALLLIAVACNQDPSLTEGVVIDKKYTAERNWTTQYCGQYMKVGASQICIMWLDDDHHTPERWEVKVRGQVDGKTYEQWKKVGGREDYNSFQRGDAWPYEPSYPVQSTSGTTTTTVIPYG